ncbi:Methionine--tRNA ligase [compost metagenome]
MQLCAAAREKGEAFQYDKMITSSLSIFRAIDQYVNLTEPYRLMKVPDNKQRVGEILYSCLEALRQGALSLWPVMPGSMSHLLDSLGCLDQGSAPGLNTSQRIVSGYQIKETSPLFPRFQEGK